LFQLLCVEEITEKLLSRKQSPLFSPAAKLLGVIALDDMSFALCEGEVHILLGENGAGKSTLMKILSGAYQKTAGEIQLNGQAIEIKSPKPARGLGIGIIYQELNLVPQLSAAENIFLGREPMRLGLIDRGAMEREAPRLLTELGIEIDVRRPVRELSIAAQQMVEVAKAISLNARKAGPLCLRHRRHESDRRRRHRHRHADYRRVAQWAEPAGYFFVRATDHDWRGDCGGGAVGYGIEREPEIAEKKQITKTISSFTCFLIAIFKS